MSRSRIAPLLAVFLAGCVAGHPVRDANSLPGPLPFAAVRAAPKAGQTSIMLLAGFSGRLEIDRDCVTVVLATGGREVLPLFYDGVTIGRDGAGLYLRDPESGEVFRDGDTFRGGGGFMPISVLSERGNTRQSVPPVCLARVDPDNVISINPGMSHGPA